MRIGIIGAKGFLGHNIVDVFEQQGYDVISVNRDNYDSHKGSFVDVLVNANGNSKRFWANSHPLEDFEASVMSVQRSIFDFKFDKFVLISSSDVYPDHGIPPNENQIIDRSKTVPYGFNKLISEQIVAKYCRSYLILRCSAMIGKYLRKGVIKDILDDKPLFVTANSKIQFIGAEEVGKIIIQLILKGRINEVYNIGGMSYIAVAEAAKILGHTVKIQQDAEFQYYDMSIEKLRSEYPVLSSRDYVRAFSATLANL